MHQTLERELPWRPDQLFDLVGDVESYPKFIPWISALSITDRGCDEKGRPVVNAQARVGYSFVRERFSSRVTLDKPALEIRVGLLSGPLKRLENLWRFAPSGQGCHLAFAI
ncbi:MAG: type II toxin-antitoxin system RatA family toxin, partial [Caulobacteraceae bacterium]